MVRVNMERLDAVNIEKPTLEYELHDIHILYG